MPEKSIIDQIKHYQRDIVKCPSDSKRMIRCIERLTVLPVTIAHLQATGVGRSVNELRKCGGEVGAAASSLVCKWKSMVQDTESEEESEVEEPVKNLKSSIDHKISNSNKKNEPSHVKKLHNSEHHEHNKKSVSSHNTHSSKTEARHSDKNRTSKESSSLRHSSKSNDKSHRDSSSKSGYGSTTDSKHSSSHKSKSDYVSKSHKSHSSNDSETDCNGSIDKNSKLKHDRSKSNKYNSDSISSDNKLKDTKHKDYKDNHRKEDKSSTSRSSKKYDLKRMESDSSDDEIYKPSNKKQIKLSSDDEQNYKKVIKHGKTSMKKKDSSNESDSKSESEEEIIPEVHIESEDNSDSDNRNHSPDNISDDEPVDSEKGSEDKASDTGSEENDSEKDNESPDEEEYIPVKIKKENPERETKSYNNSDKTHSNHVKSKYSSSSQDKFNVKQEKEESVIIKKEKSEKNRINQHSQREDKYNKDRKQKESKSRSYSESTSKEMKSDKQVRVKIEKEDDGSIDCVSGASFADALLGLSDTKKLAKRKTSSPSLEKTFKSADKSSSSSSRAKVSSKPESKISTSSPSSSKTAFKDLDLLSKNIKLEPLDVDLKATLPEITPNYKPLPHFSPPASPPNKRAKYSSQEDALSSIMSTKNQRTKVYSGNKTGFTKVPSLFDLCIQVLQNNIEGLEYTGGVPYDLLKPVLDRATADQLHQLEYYNPYLVEDTDSLWQFHCKKEFRGKEPEEFETWRELYLRSLDERERKLKALKENITQSIAKSTPIRQTKLAYIDSVVKPPRNVARQQMKMGTGKAVKHEIVSKAMVGAASGPPVSEAVSVPAPPKSNNSFPIPNFLKKKKAPLMAKALQLIKGNRFKR